MEDNRNRSMSMPPGNGDNATQEIIIALVTAFVAIFLTGVIISKFGGQGTLSPNNHYPNDNQYVGTDGNKEGNSDSDDYYEDEDEEDSDSDDYYEDEDEEDSDSDDYYEDENEEDSDSDDYYEDDSDYGDTDEEDTIEQEEETLLYTDNTEMDISACLSPSDYEVMTSADGSFSFGYPIYLFSGCKISEDSGYNSYLLYYNSDYADNEILMRVYSEDNPGDALENAKELYTSYVEEGWDINFSLEPEKVSEDGMARGLMSIADEDGGGYIIVASDGEKDYCLTFFYPDSNPYSEYDDVDYIVDCVYRYCSFSGTIYKPRTYDQFLDDDMGTKK